MVIEVLGPGCANCDRLEIMTRSLADRLGIACTIEHVRDIDVIVQRGVMVTPALVIDGKVVVAGRVPREAELAEWLTSARG